MRKRGPVGPFSTAMKDKAENGELSYDDMVND